MAKKVIVKRKKLVSITLPMYIEPNKFLNKNRKLMDKVKVYMNKNGKVCVSIRTKLSVNQIEKLFG